jgi:hypothetical protein
MSPLINNCVTVGGGVRLRHKFSMKNFCVICLTRWQGPVNISKAIFRKKSKFFTQIENFHNFLLEVTIKDKSHENDIIGSRHVINITSIVNELE